MQPHYFPYAPPHAVAHHRSTQRHLDTESKAALGQVVRLQENGKVGTRAALSVAVNRIEVRLARELACFGRLPCRDGLAPLAREFRRAARQIFLPRFTRA